MDNNKDGKIIAVVKNLESSIETQSCLMNVQVSHSKRKMIDVEDDKRRKDKREKEDMQLSFMQTFLNGLLRTCDKTNNALYDDLERFEGMFSDYKLFVEKEREKEDYYESLDDEHREFLDQKLDIKVNECADRSHSIESLLIKFKD